MKHLDGDKAHGIIADAAARASEHVTDLIFIGRCKGGIVYRASDRIWALGAMRTLINILETQDQEDVRKGYAGLDDEDE